MLYAWQVVVSGIKFQMSFSSFFFSSSLLAFSLKLFMIHSSHHLLSVPPLNFKANAVETLLEVREFPLQ